MQVKDLTEVTVRDLWRWVEDEEYRWGDLEGESLRVVQRLMESVMAQSAPECVPQRPPAMKRAHSTVEVSHVPPVGRPP